MSISLGVVSFTYHAMGWSSNPGTLCRAHPPRQDPPSPALVIKGATRNWTAMDFWSHDEFLRRYGDEPLQLHKRWNLTVRNGHDPSIHGPSRLCAETRAPVSVIIIEDALRFAHRRPRVWVLEGCNLFCKLCYIILYYYI